MQISRYTTIMYAIILIISSLAARCSSVDSITATQNLEDGDTLVSSAGSFALGFFSPGNNTNRYLGIWYKKISEFTVVWVANRDSPINDRTGILVLTSSGTLNLLENPNGITIWSSNDSSSVLNPIAQLLDNGNFVTKDKNDDYFLWQSFDYPTDTLLPEMKLGKNLVTSLDRYLSSWKSSDDPASGDFQYYLDRTGYSHLILWNDLKPLYQSGPWNGARFSGRPTLQNQIYTDKVIYGKNEVYYMFELINNSVYSRFVLTESGEGQQWTWDDRTQRWVLFYKVPTDECDSYHKCGEYASCNIDASPICGCLDNFEPKYLDGSGGCVRTKPLNCEGPEGDGFRMYSGLKVPDTGNARCNDSMNLEECRRFCLKNCDCLAYTSLNITGGGSGCLQWFTSTLYLVEDIRELPTGGQDLYVRVAFSDSDGANGTNGSLDGANGTHGSLDGANGKHGSTIKIVILAVVASIVVGLGLAFCIWKKKKNAVQKRSEGSLGSNSIEEFGIQGQKEDIDLPSFSMSIVAHATNHFAVCNKLGQGGFGPVFKGVLEDGQEIAVKRLSETSKQGISEFLNEVKCIAKVQHRNLVRLLGYCVQGEDKLLIYEYMPNKSLDWHIFDATQSRLLDWPHRFHIIDGIARGLLYLHQDSRVRIIHRDVKAANILLDKDMNPKVSDFGLARSFKENETGANTNRVVGTYGYMSPEYAIDGLFSVKSDVFSFGVLVLEIVSGSRNRGFIHRDHDHNLLGHAWRLHKEGMSLELIHEHIIQDSHFIPEVQRSIHIGLLCVQQSPEDRPNMSSVVLMLGSDGELPTPKQPGFFSERNIFESDYSSNVHSSCSATAITSALLEGRT